MTMKPGMYPIIEAGHGMFDALGYECLAGGKMYTHPDGQVIHEGNINRIMAHKLIWELYKKNVPFVVSDVTKEDPSLIKRVNKVNKLWEATNKQTYLLSIHNNAGQGKGSEIWTSVGQTKSDLIADEILKDLQKTFSDVTKVRTDRSDGDLDKEKNYTMVAKTNCPAMILEGAFFDRKHDVDWVMDEHLLHRYILIIATTLQRIYLNGIK